MRYGKLYGIGVGPGDPELLTMKARRVLEELEVLFVPHSHSEKRSLALSIVTGSVNKEWQLIDLVLPMTRNQEELRQHWQAAAKTVITSLQSGCDGGFITLGDPTLYSTFTYLLKQVKALAPEIETEIIPGISSVTAVPAWLQKALAEGEETLLIIPAEKLEYLRECLDQFDNIMVMKAGRFIEPIRDILTSRQGRKKAFLVSRCGFADGYYSDDLSSLPEQSLDYLSSVLIKRLKND